MEIHQLVAGMSYGDAISIQAKMIQQILRSWGFKSEIYSVSKHINPRIRKECFDFRLHKKHSSKDNLVILHFSTHSPVNDYFRSIPDKKILIYHNITPPEYLAIINNRIARELDKARQELASLADIPELNLADSDYNRKELNELGFKNTAVFPLTIDRELFNRKPNPHITAIYNQPHIKHFIFVGRFVPNKKFDDVILFFNYYNKFIDSDSRLFLVGSYAGTEMYHDYLRSLTLQLGLKTVYLLGHVNFDDLLAYYNLADLFICMSEHEGFCLPLLEAMHFEIPIIAYKKAAVPETLGDSGILVKNKAFPEIAEMADLILRDNCLREKIVRRQKNRLKHFSKDAMEERLKKHLSPWLQ